VYVIASAVVVDRGPFRDLPRNYTENKTLESAEQKGSYMHNTTQEGTVAEIGAHGMGLEQAGKLNIMEITSGY